MTHKQGVRRVIVSFVFIVDGGILLGSLVDNIPLAILIITALCFVVAGVAALKQHYH